MPVKCARGILMDKSHKIHAAGIKDKSPTNWRRILSITVALDSLLASAESRPRLARICFLICEELWGDSHGHRKDCFPRRVCWSAWCWFGYIGVDTVQ